MTTYCYRGRESGKLHEIERPMSKTPPDPMRIEGEMCDRDYAAEQANVTPASCYPMYSESLGVGPNPRDIARARAHGQNVDDKGRAIITSPENCKDWCRKLGATDMN